MRADTIRAPDYDDAWFLACALRAKVVFDIGANVGYDSLLASCAADLERLLVVDANPAALAVAAENLIYNNLSDKAVFIPAFVDARPHERVTFWTVGTGAAGSRYASHATTAARKNRFFDVGTTSVDYLCERYDVLPDLVKVDVEGAEFNVLQGSRRCAAQQQARFLVEMHSNLEIPMAKNAEQVLSWCDEMGYQAWYLKEKIPLERAAQIGSRGRCHLLLQPAVWPFPEWLRSIEQSAPLEAVLPEPIDRSDADSRSENVADREAGSVVPRRAHAFEHFRLEDQMAAFDALYRRVLGLPGTAHAAPLAAEVTHAH